MADPVSPASGPAESRAARSDSLRLFFALWPDDATRAALYRTGKWLHRHWGGRRMRADTLHLTLAFLGNTTAADVDKAIACADSVRGQPFELVLDQPGYWSHNRIGWLGARETPPQLVALGGALRGQLRAAGFAVEDRPLVPHITLLRKSLGGPVPDCHPVCWRIKDFVLVKSVTHATGAAYEVIRRWALA